MFRFLVLALLLAVCTAFTAPVVGASRSAVRMADDGKTNNTPAKFAPAGAFGGYKKPGEPSGWIGDNSKSLQITNFEKGEDYLFFQGPAPKTAVQEDLPSFFSPENLQAIEFQGPLQIVFTGTGFASAGALAYSLVTG